MGQPGIGQAPVIQAPVAQAAVAQHAARQQAVMHQTSGHHAVGHHAAVHRTHVAAPSEPAHGVTTVHWNQGHAPESPSDLASPIRLTQAQRPSGRSQPAPTDFFADPFGDDPLPAEQSIPITRPQQELLPPPAERAAEPTLPGETRPMNELRSLFDAFPADEPASPQGLPAPQDAPDQPALTPPASGSAPFDAAPTPKAGPTEMLPPLRESPAKQAPADGRPSLRDMLRDNPPDEPSEDPGLESMEPLPPPRSLEGDRPEREDPFQNPFDRRGLDEREADRDDVLDFGEFRDEPRRRYGEDLDEELRRPATLTCGDFRERIAQQTIDQLSLDISPPYRPDEIDQEEYEKLKAEFDARQVARQWRSIDGSELASGRLRDLAYQNAVIETDFGTTEELPLNRLSEADLAYISENWGLPRECLIEQVAYTPRSWAKTTVTWKASNLCHNPLYFEDVNLERYGHTHGPVLEPLVQTAHFFGGVLVLPYKMGVHCPSECQYPLGYYRPGNCAPWIKPAIPISARGAIAQAATMTGLFWLIP